MEKELLIKCFEDTGLRKLFTESLGQEKGLSTCERIADDFIENAQSASMDLDYFAAILEERRSLFSFAAFSNNSFCVKCMDAVTAVSDSLRVFNEAKVSPATEISCIKLGMAIENLCILFRDKDLDRNSIPEGIMKDYLDFEDNNADILPGMFRRLASLKRILASLPLLKFHITRDGDELTQCSLELTGRMPSEKVQRFETAITLPDSVLKELASLKPEIFNEMTMFYSSYSTALPSLAKTLIDGESTLEYALNIAKILVMLKKNNLPMCNCKISSRTTDLVGACDLSVLLLRKSNLGRPIVPNNVLIRKKSPVILLCGANGSGKTSYLRSIAICYIFFMAGLPVPASMGSMMPISGIYAYFDGMPDAKSFRHMKLEKDALILGLWPDTDDVPGVSADKRWNESKEVIQKLQSAGLHGVIAMRIEKSLTSIPPERIEAEPEDIPLMEALCDHEGKRSFRMKFIHRATDSRATDIISRYGLDKGNLMIRFRGETEYRFNGGTNK